MTYFESTQLNSLLPLDQSVVVFDYVVNFPSPGYYASRHQMFEVDKVVKFSFKLSTVVILCYSLSHQYMTNPIESIWELYINELASGNMDTIKSPILIILQLSTFRDMLLTP